MQRCTPFIYIARCERIPFGAGLALLSCLFNLLLVGLLTGVTGSVPLIHFSLPLVVVPCAGWAPLAAVSSMQIKEWRVPS